jgi:multidrug transporter EmrE-like cation transporter
MLSIIYIAVIGFFLAILELLGQVSEKDFFDILKNDNRYTLHIIITILCYFGVSYLLSLSYNFENVGTMNNLWSAMSIVIFALYGFIIGEKFTKIQLTGFLFALIGITIIVVDSYHKEQRHLKEQREKLKMSKELKEKDDI